MLKTTNQCLSTLIDCQPRCIQQARQASQGAQIQVVQAELAAAQGQNDGILRGKGETLRKPMGKLREDMATYGKFMEKPMKMGEKVWMY